MTETLSEMFTEAQVLARVVRLNPARLDAYVAAEAVLPADGADGRLYAAVDLARLELLCDLAEHFDMGPDALAVMLSVIDSLHAARRERTALLAAIRGEARDVQVRIAAVLVEARG